MFTQEFSGDEEMEELLERILNAEDDRYLEIPTTDSHEAFEDMEDWVESVQDDRLQNRLFSALNGSRPFRRFKDVLLDWPTDRDAWFAFKRDRTMRRALRWLETEGIEVIPVTGVEQKEGASDHH